MRTVFSSQEKGRLNAERLMNWLARTPLANVPKNQFGAAARYPICELLGIPPSTIQTNKKIQQLFNTLDEKLKWLPRETVSKYDREELISQFKEMKQHRDELLVQNESLKNRLSRMQYLEDTGIDL